MISIPLGLIFPGGGIRYYLEVGYEWTAVSIGAVTTSSTLHRVISPH